MQGLGQRGGLALDVADYGGRQRIGRQRAGAVAGMNPGLLDMFHDAGDMHGVAVGECVDIDLDRVGEIAVDQQRPLLDTANSEDGPCLRDVADIARQAAGSS